MRTVKARNGNLTPALNDRGLAFLIQLNTSNMSVCCIGCELMKKLEQVTVHMEPIDKDFVCARADLMGVSNSVYVAGLIAKDRIEDERRYHLMKKVHEKAES